MHTGGFQQVTEPCCDVIRHQPTRVGKAVHSRSDMSVSKRMMNQMMSNFGEDVPNRD